MLLFPAMGLAAHEKESVRKWDSGKKSRFERRGKVHYESNTFRPQFNRRF
jgi:hypothetical protein